MDEIKDLLECIAKFDKTEDLETKGKYFDTIQKDAERLVKLFNAHRVSDSYYYLKPDDCIQKGDEYRDEVGRWRKTGQIDRKYNPSKHYKHRRLK